MPPTRRSVLRLTGGLTVCGLAGCLGDSTDSSPTASETATGTPTDTDTVQRSAVPEWTDWTPSPDALGLDGGYRAVALEPSEIDTYSDTLPASAVSEFGPSPSIDGLGSLADQELALALAETVFGFVGDHETEQVRTFLDDRGLTRQRTVGGIDIYAPDADDRGQAVAVGSGVLFTSMTEYSDVTVDPVDALAAVARDGNRLPAAVPDVRTALELAAPGESIAVRAPDDGTAFVDGARAGGLSLRLGDDQSTVTAAFVGEDVTADAVQSWADERSSVSTSPTVTTDGSAVVATATRPTGEVEALTPDWPTEATTDPPRVQWQATYEEAAGHLTIEHRGGDTVASSDLYVRGSGFADTSGADQASPGPWQGETSDDGGVVAGNSVTVGVTSDYEIRLVYEFPDSDRSATLFETEA